MNDRDQELQLDDVLLERIVDGGMTPRELRAAVELLDRDSDGWKRSRSRFWKGKCWASHCVLLASQQHRSLWVSFVRLIIGRRRPRVARSFVGFA